MEKSKTIRVLMIKFNMDIMNFETDVIELKNDLAYNLADYRKIIDCSMIDIVNLGEDVCIIIDDEGLLKSGNPVLNIETESGHELQLAGTLIFAGNRQADEGDEITSLETGKCLNLLHNLKLSVIGVTR
ncbi:DUF3846 domain-containing protein [Virgibacillus siamensis]|uniref:DUF3846 domain-containing protein n=1 Tax=Virgibacillus siamensis TaxID=480071 RepID=UPI000985EB86|nr:hypothetical protein [Virgibacillus siamensis]